MFFFVAGDGLEGWEEGRWEFFEGVLGEVLEALGVEGVFKMFEG